MEYYRLPSLGKMNLINNKASYMYFHNQYSQIPKSTSNSFISQRKPRKLEEYERLPLFKSAKKIKLKYTDNEVKSIWNLIRTKEIQPPNPDHEEESPHLSLDKISTFLRDYSPLRISPISKEVSFKPTCTGKELKYNLYQSSSFKTGLVMCHIPKVFANRRSTLKLLRNKRQSRNPHKEGSNTLSKFMNVMERASHKIIHKNAVDNSDLTWDRSCSGACNNSCRVL